MNIPLVKVLNAMGEYFIMMLNVIWLTLKKPPKWSLLRDQLYSIGVASLPVVAVTGFSTGLVLAAQSFFQLSEFGLTSATGYGGRGSLDKFCEK